MSEKRWYANYKSNFCVTFKIGFGSACVYKKRKTVRLFPYSTMTESTGQEPCLPHTHTHTHAHQKREMRSHFRSQAQDWLFHPKISVPQLVQVFQMLDLLQSNEKQFNTLLVTSELLSVK